MPLSPLQIVALVERYKRERDRFEKLAAIVSRKQVKAELEGALKLYRTPSSKRASR